MSRGLHLRVRNLGRECKADVACLQETKPDFMTCSIVHSLWGYSHVDWFCLDSRGHPEVFDYVGYKRIGKSRRVRRGFSVVSFFRNIENQFSWTFVDVYSPNIDVDRRLLWDELASVLSWWNLPWCNGGISTFLAFLVKDGWSPLQFSYGGVFKLHFLAWAYRYSPCRRFLVKQ